jgi:hypothetical protein
MGSEQNHPTKKTELANGVTAVHAESSPAKADWESHLHAGLRMARVTGEARAALANALGAMGVEAEYYLSLLAGFPGSDGPSHARAELFLSRLEAAARRLYHAADTLEIATQGYLSALEAGYPGARSEGTEGDPWWPAPPDFELGSETIELRLRRCGYAYRHVVEVYLSTNISAIASQMKLVLYALTILPPAGVLPVSSLYQGLYELSSSFQGYIIPHHITELDARTPGLLTGIARLRQLDIQEDTSLQSDLRWAQSQLRSVQEFLQSPSLSSAQREWATTAASEWQQTVQLLASL